MRKSFNEAAHKLGYWPVLPAVAAESQEPSAALKAATNDDRDVVAHAGKLVLALGALGVVYGDIGTSPLYTMQVIFKSHAEAATANVAGVFGIISLVFWSLLIIVSLKYAIFIMRAHNRGDGGIMALAALITRKRVPRAAVLVTLGIFGAGLFLGDGMITPAISVMSAIEGLNVATPGLEHLVVPISLVILLGLFAVQRFGTGSVGWLFGPVMLIWFFAIGLLGVGQVVGRPEVLKGLSPTYGAQFMINHGVAAFLTLGAVVLCVTGAEALYADRGHFGAVPIRRTWFAIVFPLVLLSYLGQAAFILGHPHSVAGKSFSPFFMLVPSGLRIAMVILATMATIIASQAAITGSFSVAKQAIQLGFLPRLKVVHTSKLEGQIYVPLINWALAVGVGALVLTFQHSVKLAEIYGVAVTGTFILDSILSLAVAHSIWRTPTWRLVVIGAVFLTVEIAFFSSNLTKIAHGAWLPLLVGFLVATVMITWRRGRVILTRNRTEEEGSLSAFLVALKDREPPVRRVPGTAIFLNPGKLTTPLALRAEVEHNGVFHDRVVSVSVESIGLSHVDDHDRLEVEVLGEGLFKVAHVTIRSGYQDTSNVPKLLALARKRGKLPRNLDLEHASYVISRMIITPSQTPGMSAWRKRIFIFMARNATSPISHFHLPGDRTMMMGSQVGL